MRNLSTFRTRFSATRMPAIAKAFRQVLDAGDRGEARLSQGSALRLSQDRVETLRPAVRSPITRQA